METAKKKNRTMARSWRAEMQENIKEAHWELSWWLKKEMETRTNLELEKAELNIKDAKRIAAFANDMDKSSLTHYVEEAIVKEE